MSDFVYVALTLLSFAGLALLIGALDARLGSASDPDHDPRPGPEPGSDPDEVAGRSATPEAVDR